MATQNVDILQVNTAPSVKSISDLKKEIKDLKGQLLSLEQGSKEYNDVLVEVANKTHDLKEVQEQVARTSNDFGDRLMNVQGTVAGLSGAFQTVLGSLSLMGVNLGDDVKMLKMLNSAMAITQGVAAIDSGVKAFKALTISIKASTSAMSGLKKALLASGIGALVLLVGSLISAFNELSEASAVTAERIKDDFGKMESAFNRTDREFQRLLKRMKAEGSTEEELYDKQIEFYNDRVKSLTGQIELTMAHFALYKEGSDAYNANKETLDALYKERSEYFEKIRDLETEQYVAGLNRQNAADDAAIKAAADAAKKRLAAETKAREESAKVFAANVNNSNTEAPASTADMAHQEDELRALTDYYTKRAEIVIANEKDIDDQLLAIDIEYRDTREELLRSRYANGLITKAEFDNEMAQLEVEAAEFQIEQEERVTAKIQEEAEKRKAAQQAWAQSVKVVATSVSSILGTLGENLEEGTRQWKNLKTAQAVIDTIAGSVTAFMTTMQQIGGIPGLIAGAAAAAATLAAGMVEVNKIKSTTVSKGSAASASGGSSLGSVSASAVSVNAMQVTPTRQVQTQEDVANMPDTRVYVLERDITDTQRRVAVTTQNATY